MNFVKKEWQFRDIISENELNRMEDGIEEGITKAEQAQQIANEAKATADDVQSELSAHISATTGVHGATSAATPNTIVQRDPAGRFKAGAPSDPDDVARKAEVDERAPLSGAVFTGPVEYSSNPRESNDLNNEINPGWVVFTENTANRPERFSNYGVVRIERRTSSRVAQTAYGLTGNSDAKIVVRVLGDNGWSQWYKVWNESNDGAGSGLDADLLRGMQPSTSATANTIAQRDSQGRLKAAAPSASDDVARKAEVDAMLPKSGGVMTGDINSSAADFQIGKTNNTGRTIIKGGSSGSVATGANIHVEGIDYGGTGAGGNVRVNLPAGKNLLVNGNTVWHAGNDGAGSGLDSDMLDGMQPSTSASANTIVQRDSSGRIKAAAPSASDDVVRKAELDGHANRTDNPHGVTKAQVGLSNVQNYGIATQAQAEAGTANNVYMTPLRTKQAIDQFVPIETGTWTPELRFGGSTSGITYTFRAGWYTRIANVVYWTFNIVLSSKGSASGVATIVGLPFSNNSSVISFYHAVGQARNISVPSGQWLSSYVSLTNVTPVTSTDDFLTSSDFSNNSSLYASGFYFI